MFVLGLVGGVASGKSVVAEQLQQLGAGVLDADRAGHEVLEQPDVRQALATRWGEGVFHAEGHVDRRALAKIVFAPTAEASQELAALEKITHPRIKTLLQARMQQLAAEGVAVVVLDAPVLFKAGWDALCDLIVFVDAPDEIRRQRAIARGWSGDEFARRESAQELLSWKRSQAHVVIDNAGTLAMTRQQVIQLWNQIRQTQGGGSPRPQNQLRDQDTIRSR